MRTRHAFLMILSLGLASTGLIGCGDDDDDDVVDTTTCADVCNTYQECVEGDFNVGACESNCNEQTDAYDDPEAALEGCQDCINELSCNGTFECEDACANIIEVDTEAVDEGQ